MLSTSERTQTIFGVINRHLPGDQLHSPSSPPIYPEHAVAPLYALLDRLGPLPGATAVLGVCDDGLPLLLDLADPSPGSFLVIGDEHSGKTQLLQTILASSSYLNPASRVGFHIISPNPGLFNGLRGLPNCRAILSTYDRIAGELIVELSALAEQRRCGRSLGSIELLAIDNLPEFIKHNDYEVNSYLRWLVGYGPDASIRTFASIKTSQTWRLDREFAQAFGKQLVGRNTSLQLTASSLMPPATPQLPEVFAVNLEDGWVRFWVPQS